MPRTLTAAVLLGSASIAARGASHADKDKDAAAGPSLPGPGFQ